MEAVCSFIRKIKVATIGMEHCMECTTGVASDVCLSYFLYGVNNKIIIMYM